MSSLPDQDALPAAIGRYRVTHRLAVYAESGVFHAVDPLLERRLVIKVFSLDGISPSAADRVRATFFDEMRRMGILVHSGLVTLFDAGEASSGLFIAAEFVEGTTLAEWFAAHRDCPLTERVSIITQIAEVLEYVHARGHAHLGLGLSNVFITADGALRVAGFGIRPVLDALRQARRDQLPPAGDLVRDEAGEQVRDARADVRALGEIARTLLAPDESSPEVALVLHRATSSDPDERFQSAAPFSDALLGALGLSDLHVRIAWEVARSGGAFVDEPTVGRVEVSPLDATRLPSLTKTRLGAGVATPKPDARS